MSSWIYLAGSGALLVGGLAATGLWRLLFALFAIRPRNMTVRRLGLGVTSQTDKQHVNVILRSFAGGFNKMITARSRASYRRYCESLPVLYRPFAEEGLAMGYTLRHLFRFQPERFEEELVRANSAFRYLYYVGLGFWSGMRNHNPDRLSRVVENLDPLHGYLCYDGYGFKHAFFDYRQNPDCLQRLDGLDGYARHAAYQGVGRAFFFLFMSAPELLIEHLDRLGDVAQDAAAGVGLAAVFVHPDRLEVAQSLADCMPRSWHHHFHLGMCFGLKARAINHREQFERDLSRMSFSVQEAVTASIRQCDKIEQRVRSENTKEGYRCWRDRVREWMADRIRYPMAGLKSSLRRSTRPLPESTSCVG